VLSTITKSFRVVCTNVDKNLISDHRNFKAKYLQNGEKIKLKVDPFHFSSFNIMSHFIYTDLISNLLDPRLVDPGLILIYVGANNQGPLYLDTILKVTEI